MIQGHLMRLVKGGDREVWKCARDCGFTRIAPNPFLKEKQPP